MGTALGHETPGAKRSQRFQHGELSAGCPEHERPFCQLIEHRSRPESAEAAGRRRAFDREGTGENGQVGERSLQLHVEQLVGPRHRRSQRSMAGRRACAGREELEAAIQPGGDLVDVERAQARRGQLDRQRQPVETTDDLGDGCPFGDVAVELRHHGAGPLHEQLDGRPIVVARRQWRHLVHLLTGHPQPLPARRDDRRLSARTEDPIDQVGDRIEDVLAVVEQQHHLRVREHRRQSFSEHFTGAAVDAQRGGDDVDGGLLRWHPPVRT